MTSTDMSIPFRSRVWTTPSVLVSLELILIGAASGSLGGPAGALVVAVVGLAWSLLLTLAVGWLGGGPARRRWGLGIVLACFVVVGLFAGSLAEESRRLGWAITALIIVVGAVWAGVALRLSRSRLAEVAWSGTTLGLAAFAAAVLTGTALMSQLLMGAFLASKPDEFADLVRGYLGDAEAFPFYSLNTTLEWMLLPLAVLLGWHVPAVRRLLVACLAIFVAMRVWTYLYFVPLITDWADTDAAMTDSELDQARLWVGLSWVRFTGDLAVSVLLGLAVLTIRPSAPQRGDALAIHSTDQAF